MGTDSISIAHNVASIGTSRRPLRWIEAAGVVNSDGHSAAGAYSSLLALPVSSPTGPCLVWSRGEGNLAQFKFAIADFAPTGNPFTWKLLGLREVKSLLTNTLEFVGELVGAGTGTCGAGRLATASTRLTIPSGQVVGLVDVLSIVTNERSSLSVRGATAGEWASLEFDAVDYSAVVLEVRAVDGGVFVAATTY